MKVVVDFDVCQGHGVCEAEAPEVFQVDEDGNLTVLLESPPESMRSQLEDAEKYCPQLAITIED